MKNQAEGNCFNCDRPIRHYGRAVRLSQGWCCGKCHAEIRERCTVEYERAIAEGRHPRPAERLIRVWIR